MALIVPFSGFTAVADTTDGRTVPGSNPPPTRSRPFDREEDAAAPPEPTFYAYRVDYRTLGGIEKSRTSLIAKLDPFDVESRQVAPVVDTRPGASAAAADTLARSGIKSGLVVAAYEDPQFEVERLMALCPALHTAAFAAGDQMHTVWPLTRRRAADQIAAFFRDKLCVPFDGIEHFRAARRLKDEAHAHQLALPDAAFYPLVLLVNVYDFGANLNADCTAVPPLADFDLNRFILRCHERFDVQTYPWQPDAARAATFRRFQEDFRIHGTTEIAIGACFPGERQFFLFTLKEGEDARRMLPPDVPAVLATFSAPYLRRVFVEDLYWQEAPPPDAWTQTVVFAEPARALAALDRGDAGAVFFLNPPGKRGLMELAAARARLPAGAVRLEPPAPEGLIHERIPMLTRLAHEVS